MLARPSASASLGRLYTRARRSGRCAPDRPALPPCLLRALPSIKHNSHTARDLLDTYRRCPGPPRIWSSPDPCRSDKKRGTEKEGGGRGERQDGARTRAMPETPNALSIPIRVAPHNPYSLTFCDQGGTRPQTSFRRSTRVRRRTLSCSPRNQGAHCVGRTLFWGGKGKGEAGPAGTQRMPKRSSDRRFLGRDHRFPSPGSVCCSRSTVLSMSAAM